MKALQQQGSKGVPGNLSLGWRDIYKHKQATETLLLNSTINSSFLLLGLTFESSKVQIIIRPQPLFYTPLPQVYL